MIMEDIDDTDVALDKICYARRTGITLLEIGFSGRTLVLDYENKHQRDSKAESIAEYLENIELKGL